MIDLGKHKQKITKKSLTLFTPLQMNDLVFTDHNLLDQLALT